MTRLFACVFCLGGLVTACGDDDSSSDGGVFDSGVDAATADAGIDVGPSDTAPTVVTLLNDGTSRLEGHTPRGFMGMGTGLFVGDNLNPSFPEGDGVQAFVSFDLSSLPAGTVVSAVLSSAHGSTTGTPFEDLGDLTAEEVRFDAFSSSVWDLAPEPGGASCVLGTSAAGPFSCDMTALIDNAIAAGRSLAQVRLRLELAGDSDSSADLVTFFITNSNTNEAGIFELEVTVAP